MRELLIRLAGHPWLTLELALASLFVNLLAFADTIFVMIVLRRYITYGFDGTLILLTAGTIIAVLMQLGLREARTRLAHGVSAKADNDLSQRFFDVLVRARAARLPDLEGGKDYLPALSDMRQAYEAPKVTAFLDAPFSLVYVAATFVLSSELAAVVVIGMLLSLVLGVYTVRRNFKFMNTVNTVSAGARGLVSSAWSGSDAVRTFGGRELYRDKWKQRMTEVDLGRRKADDGREFGQGLTGGASVLVRVGIYAVGARLVVEGELTFAALIGASILGSYAVQKVTAFVQTWPAMTQADEAKSRLNEFFSLPLEKRDGLVPESYSGRIAFKDVAYAFEGGLKPLFTNLSFTLEPGRIMAVRGPNGSGKTTLMRLMAGILEPAQGEIYVDGASLNDVDAVWWRSRLVYMPQEPHFVAATVRENLVSGNPGLDQDALNRIIRAADLRQFIDSSPQGLETMLSGAAQGLPLGTRKRLALARAMCTEGPLMLLDEPTEGLDAQGRNAVYRVMNTLAGQGNTIVVVTSDPNILKGAGCVLDLGAKPIPRLTLKGQADAPGPSQGGES